MVCSHTHSYESIYRMCRPIRVVYRTVVQCSFTDKESKRRINPSKKRMERKESDGGKKRSVETTTRKGKTKRGKKE